MPQIFLTWPSTPQCMISCGVLRTYQEMELLRGRVVDVGDDGVELACFAPFLAPNLDQLLSERGSKQRGDVVPGGGAPLRPHRQIVLAFGAIHI